MRVKSLAFQLGDWVGVWQEEWRLRSQRSKSNQKKTMGKATGYLQKKR